MDLDLRENTFYFTYLAKRSSCTGPRAAASKAGYQGVLTTPHVDRPQSMGVRGLGLGEQQMVAKAQAWTCVIGSLQRRDRLFVVPI